MLAVYVWHTVIPHFPNLPKTSNIAVLFPKLLKKKTRHKERKRLLKEFQKGSKNRSRRGAPSSEGRPVRGSRRHCPGDVFVRVIYKVPPPRGRRDSQRPLCRRSAGPRPWSRTGASCTPASRLRNWCRESAVLGWSSSCRISSCSSFSSSFCG